MHQRASAPARASVSLVVAASCYLSACGASAPPLQAPDERQLEARGRECVRPFVGRDSPYRQQALPLRAEEGALLEAVPPEAARTMRAAGVSSLVARALGMKAEQTPSVAMLVTRQELGMRLISLETQLAAVIFEAECTGELIEAMTFELEDRADLRELRLALGSLLVGAVSATVGGIWDLTSGESKGPAVLGLSGGLAGAALGAAAFVKRPEYMRYMHPRNLLQPVLRGVDDDELFPGFVFGLLTLQAPDGGPSPRDRLLVRWQTLIEEAVEPAQREAASQLLYGGGGVYNQQLMSLRERLYDALESELNAQARDLELLDSFLVRALERPVHTHALD